ncbi:hypothetical protein QF035_009218 [Streptomyces umbrinus]|uniref:Uncharacterized protein n=1 Tax=Streptomyces umbrinus TaxID=67370 RepID=A0ABU0T742_9ACTN|nr:hypothetical protein [Streptomyces umbrinus]
MLGVHASGSTAETGLELMTARHPATRASEPDADGKLHTEHNHGSLGKDPVDCAPCETPNGHGCAHACPAARGDFQIDGHDVGPAAVLQREPEADTASVVGIGHEHRHRQSLPQCQPCLRHVSDVVRHSDRMAPSVVRRPFLGPEGDGWEPPIGQDRSGNRRHRSSGSGGR